MNHKNTYTGSKTQNYFTAYLLRFIRGKRRDYLEKKISIADKEDLVENVDELRAQAVIEDLLERQEKECVLLLEAEGKYTEWSEMSDSRLVEAVSMFRDEERRLIYQHVFEERSFEQISRLNGLPVDRCKGIYYYAIRKIRNTIGGRKNEL